MTLNELSRWIYDSLVDQLVIDGHVVPVYDATPTDESMPYVVIAGLEIEPDDPSKTGASPRRIVATIESYSNALGFREIHELADQVDALLADPPPATGPAPWVAQSELEGFDSFRADLGEGQIVRAGSYRRHYTLAG